jgi:hypothetical protein
MQQQRLSSKVQAPRSVQQSRARLVARAAQQEQQVGGCQAVVWWYYIAAICGANSNCMLPLQGSSTNVCKTCGVDLSKAPGG